MFVNIRGWIECDTVQLRRIRELIGERDDPTGSYNKGWTFPPGSNGHVYAFYGANIRTRHLDWFLDQLRRIAALAGSDEDDERVRGLFIVSREDEGMSQWHVHHGEIVFVAADPRHVYLDDHL